jgi:hypothetical protein
MATKNTTYNRGMQITLYTYNMIPMFIFPSNAALCQDQYKETSSIMFDVFSLATNTDGDERKMGI